MHTHITVKNRSEGVALSLTCVVAVGMAMDLLISGKAAINSDRQISSGK